MSIYVLTEYVEECKAKGVKSNWNGLQNGKKIIGEINLSIKE